MVKVRPARGNSNRWEYDIRFKWPDGTTYRERANAPTSNRSASLRWAQARETDLLAKGKASQEEKASVFPTLEEFWPRVLSDHYKANRKKPSTIEAAASIFKNHLKDLHAKRLDSITPADISALKGKLAGSKPKTVNNILSVLGRIFRCAIDWDVIQGKPRIHLLRTTEPTMAWYELEDYRRLVEESKFSRRVHLLVLLGGSAGMRRGEIIALKWSDVDLERAQVRIERAMWRKHEETPKGGRGRLVPLTPQLVDVLRAHRHLGERVLYNEQGDELSNRTIRNWLARAQRLAKLPDDGGIHILRHTFCSHLAAAGVPAKAIQELAGHADLKTTMRYLHLAPGDRQNAIDILHRYYVQEKGAKARRHG